MLEELDDNTSDWEMDDEKVEVTEDMADSMIKVVKPEAGEAPESHVSKQKTFHTRDVYVSLESAGLTKLPPVAGVFLSYHAASTQWHSAYPHESGTGHSHRAPAWGTGLRSERQALLQALKFVWHTYVQRTGHGKSHLAALEAAIKDSV